jgi:arsenate reductase
MAASFLQQYGKGLFNAESAGLGKAELNPYVVQVMEEEGINIKHNQTRDIFDLFKKGKHYQAVISLSDSTISEQSPIFPGLSKRMDWSFPDPSQFTGTPAEILDKTRRLRDQIKDNIMQFIHEATQLDFWLTKDPRPYTYS